MDNMSLGLTHWPPNAAPASLAILLRIRLKDDANEVPIAGGINVVGNSRDMTYS